MNIAFEISPLLTASGTFGDKSGVYRYIYGLITSLAKTISQKNYQSKIILFTYNRSLLSNFHNLDIFSLLNQKNYIFLNKFYEFRGEPKIGTSIKKISFKSSLIKFLFKLIDKFFHVKIIYNNLREKIHQKQYLKYINDEFKKNNVRIIFNSETGFYPLKNYKHIITIYDLTPNLFPLYHRSETIDLYQGKIDFAKNYCHGIICISQSTKKDLLKYYPSFKKKKIIVAYPGINSSINQSITKEEEKIFDDIVSFAKKNGQCLSEKKYLLYFGTFEPRKNVISLVKAFINLQESIEIPSGFKLVLIGGEGWGNTKKITVDYLNENFPIKSKSNIILFNYLSDKYLFTLIKNAYATVYPSLYEGFGLPVLESMKLGTPVICSNNSSLPEVGGEAVLYFNTNNNQDLKDKIKLLIGNSRLAKELSKKGIEQSKKFDWKETAKKLYQFCNDLVKNN